jgi:hypothetical protein
MSVIRAISPGVAAAGLDLMMKELHNGQEPHSLDARRADLGADPPQRVRCDLSAARTSRGSAADAWREPPFVSAEMVSDYVAGRLDAETAQLVEIAARADPALARALAEARAIRDRVKERLTGNRE